MNIYILSNVNMDSLKLYFKDHSWAGSCAYGNYMVDLLDADSDLYNKDIQAVLLYLDGDVLQEYNDLEDLLHAIEQFLSVRNILFIISTIFMRPNYIETYQNTSAFFEFAANARIIEFQQKNKLLLLDSHRIALKLGEEALYADKYWYIGRIKYTNTFFQHVSNELSNLIAAHRSGSKKLLVLDLDNTLWGGIIGDDGEKVKLSNEGEGLVFTEFQKCVKRLKEFGVLLAVNSKNEMKNALLGLSLNNTILVSDDFIVIKANWNDKVSNLREIADELNLGLDSIVFIDDSPAERALVREYLPMVTVPEFPDTMFNYKQWFIQEVVYPYFPKTVVTGEDRNKSNQYRASISRKTLRKTLDLNEFLKSLNICLRFHIDDPALMERIAQMTQKTNQFNLSTIRCTVEQVREFIANSAYRVYAVEYSDKFLNEGIVGTAIVKMEETHATIENFLISCRVFNRGVEEELLETILSDLSKQGTKSIAGIYNETDRNIIVKDFYSRMNFNRTDKGFYERHI